MRYAKIAVLIAITITLLCTSPALAILYSVVDIKWTETSTTANVDTGESQLFIDIVDIGASGIRFSFKNIGSNDSSITQIYFQNDSGSQLDGIVLMSSSSGVEFSEVSGDLGKPPGGQNIGWVNNATDFRADSDSPTAPNGINPGEWLSIDFSLKSGVTFDDVIATLDNKSWKIAFHVQAFADGKSDAFVIDKKVAPVPEPATMLLFGTGIAGLAGIARRKRD